MTDERTDDFLAHFGVKGMKWGVRNDDAPASKSSLAKSDKAAVKSAKADAKAHADSVKREARAVKKDQAAEQYKKAIKDFNAKPKPFYLTEGDAQRYRRNMQKEVDRNTKAAQDIRNGKLTDRQKQLIVGASVAVGIMAAYGAYKYVDSGQFNQLKNKVGELATGQKFQFKKNADLAKDMSADDIFNKVVRHVNPTYGGYGSKMNCRRATFAYEMRRRGYDVKATLSNAATGQNQLGVHNALNPGEKLPTHGLGLYKSIVTEAYENKEKTDAFGKQAVGPVTKLLQYGGNKSPWGENIIPVVQPKGLNLADVFNAALQGQKIEVDNVKATSQNIFKSLAQNPDGARGELGVGWTLGGGHSMSWEKIRGQVHVFDNQTRKHYKSPEDFKEFAGMVTEAAWTRLDNVQLNEDFLQRWVTNV